MNMLTLHSDSHSRSFIPRMKGSTLLSSRGRVARPDSTDSTTGTTGKYGAVLAAAANLALGAGALPRPVQRINRGDTLHKDSKANVVDRARTKDKLGALSASFADLDIGAGAQPRPARRQNSKKDIIAAYIGSTTSPSPTFSVHLADRKRPRTLKEISRHAQVAVEHRIAERSRKIKELYSRQKSQATQKISAVKEKVSHRIIDNRDQLKRSTNKMSMFILCCSRPLLFLPRCRCQSSSCCLLKRMSLYLIALIPRRHSLSSTFNLVVASLITITPHRRRPSSLS